MSLRPLLPGTRCAATAPQRTPCCTPPAAWPVHPGGTRTRVPLSTGRNNYSWKKRVAPPGWIWLNWFLTGLWLGEPAAAEVLGGRVDDLGGDQGWAHITHPLESS